MSKQLGVSFALGFSIALTFAADPAGKWKMTAEGPDGNTYNFDLVNNNENRKLTGSTSNTEAGTIVLRDVVFADNQLTFKLTYDPVGLIAFKLRMDGNTLKGTLVTPDDDTGTVSGIR